MNKSHLANYSITTKRLQRRLFLLIEDHNTGGLSVTNCIEDIVASWRKDISFQPENTEKSILIIYKDSEGYWDGFDEKAGTLVALNERSFTRAASAYLNLIT